MLAVLLALASAVGYGGSDYSAGLASRRANVVRITLLGEAASVALLALILPWSGLSVPSPAALAWGAAGGIGEAAGALALYAGFRRAAFSVAGPLSAVGSAGFSVLGRPAARRAARRTGSDRHSAGAACHRRGLGEPRRSREPGCGWGLARARHDLGIGRRRGLRRTVHRAESGRVWRRAMADRSGSGGNACRRRRCRLGDRRPASTRGRNPMAGNPDRRTGRHGRDPLLPRGSCGPSRRNRGAYILVPRGHHCAGAGATQRAAGGRPTGRAVPGGCLRGSHRCWRRWVKRGAAARCGLETARLAWPAPRPAIRRPAQPQ